MQTYKKPKTFQKKVQKALCKGKKQGHGKAYKKHFFFKTESGTHDPVNSTLLSRSVSWVQMAGLLPQPNHSWFGSVSSLLIFGHAKL